MAHFHIRWDTGVLDWERHATRAEAEKSAKELALRGQTYKIEEVQEDCEVCKTGPYERHATKTQ